jgi:ligand-binding sensor domain-containing protein
VAPESVVGLAQTSDGFLWLGTPTGLFRFDGTRFELFHSSFGDQLLSTNIVALFAPPSGGLWVGYAFGGFSFLKNDRVTNYDETASATGSVWNFTQDKATTSGLKLELRRLLQSQHGDRS